MESPDAQASGPAAGVSAVYTFTVDGGLDGVDVLVPGGVVEIYLVPTGY